VRAKLSSDKLKKISERFVCIKPEEQHFHEWIKMWDDYSSNRPADSVLKCLWQKIQSGTGNIRGYIVIDKNKSNAVVGFFNYILHEDTWSESLSCYVEDAFIKPDYRRTGAMFSIFETVLKLSNENGWYKTYWMTEQDNINAQKFYNRIANKTSWIRYEL
jgi:GNAT superfamily N-acetyltransferase